MKSLGVAGLALGLSLAVSASAHAQGITIGVAGPMTGSEAVFGSQFRNGAEMAVADINAAGGVLGKRLTLQVGDDACDPKQARSVAEKFVAARVPFVAGHFCSSSSIPASDAYADGNVLQISPASTNPLFTERRLWNVARVVGRDDQQGLVAAEYIGRHYGGKNVAILHDKTTYGKGLADETKKALNRAGLQEKLFTSYSKGDKDFSAIVSRLKYDKIDLVFIGGYHQEAGLILRQMRDQGLRTVLMAGDAMNDNEFASIAGPAADGTLFTFGPDPRNKPTAKAIVAKFRARNIDPLGYTLYAYAAVQVWAQAAARAGTTDARRVMDTVKAGEWDTVLGKLGFDAKGDIKTIDYVVYRWDARGNFAEIAPGVAPSIAPTVLAQPSPQAAVPAPQPPSPPPPLIAQAPAPAPPPAPAALPPAKATVGFTSSPEFGRRVALVIGNSAYKSEGMLPNTKRDATAIAAAFKELGFHSVTLETDLGRERMMDALRNFARLADTADWAVVYFAGHGMEVGGTNYLLPVDAVIESDRDMSFAAIPLEQLMNVTERARKLRLVMLDSCRNNPFAARMKRTAEITARSAVSRGFSRVEPNAGTLVIYAAKDGETASDGDGTNSPFTTALLKNLRLPGIEVRRLFDYVRDDVQEMTKRKQLPYTYGSVPGREDFYFLR